MYLYAAGFVYGGRDIQTDGNNGHRWHYNITAEKALDRNYAGCGGMANLVRYLLAGDYEEVGYINHTYAKGLGGGHVYNYVKKNDKYYVFDMTFYTANNFATGMTAYTIVDNLSEYADKWKNLYDGIEVIYAQHTELELPLSWNLFDDVYITYLPESNRDVM